jgi:FkbM family methyltransferase
MQGQVRIVAFEPDDELRARLNYNLQQNAVQGVDVEAVALSDRQGTADLYIDLEQRGRNTLERSALSEARREGRRVELDTLHARLVARHITRVDALKIDIEGHELPVLRHFFEHAPVTMWPRIVLAEYTHDANDSIAALLHAVGYRTVLQTALNRAYERACGKG